MDSVYKIRFSPMATLEFREIMDKTDGSFAHTGGYGQPFKPFWHFSYKPVLYDFAALLKFCTRKNGAKKSFENGFNGEKHKLACALRK